MWLTRHPAQQSGTDRRQEQTEQLPGEESALQAEQNQVANLDACIQQAAEVLDIGRTAVARSFFEQNASEIKEPTTDPRQILHAGRQSIVDQMKLQRPQTRANMADNTTPLYDLNQQLGHQLARLTNDVAQGMTRPEVFLAQLRATLEAYRRSVENVVAARVTINIR